MEHSSPRLRWATSFVRFSSIAISQERQHALQSAMANAWRKQESRAVARKPRDAAAVLFGLKFADNIHYNFKNSQASNAMLQTSKYTVTKRI